MSLADLLPSVRCLTRQEKLRLIQLLAVELEKDDDEDERLQNAIHALARQNAIGRGRRTLIQSGGDAANLMKLLDEEKSAS